MHVSKHFPSVRRECKEAAARFFGCFSTNGRMLNDYVRAKSLEKYEIITFFVQDVYAGARGVLACEDEMAAYDACMTKTVGQKAARS